MHLRNIGIAGLAALSVSVSAQGPARPEGGKPAALSVSARTAAGTVDAFHAALRRGDVRSAAVLLADDALIFEEGGVERTKAEYVAHHLPADATFSQVVSSIVTRRAGSSTGTFAWIATEGRSTGAFKGKPVDRTTTETMLLRRVGRNWRIFHIHWSSAVTNRS
jgi:ketosteroid isomerase-like protein